MPDKKPIARLLVGVGGSIHAALLPAYMGALREHAAHEIRVVMTHSAAQIVPARTLREYCGNEVYTDLWGLDSSGSALHVGLAEWADQLLILPATANLLGKAANGIADDIVSTMIVAYSGHIAFAPAMNAAMWKAVAVQRNIATLKSDGHSIITPSACAPVSRPDKFGEGVSPTIRLVLRHLTSSNSANGESEHFLTELNREGWPERNLTSALKDR